MVGAIAGRAPTLTALTNHSSLVTIQYRNAGIA